MNEKLGCFYLCFVEDLNWNALEWDRAAEELTWERVGLLLFPCVLGPLCMDSWDMPDLSRLSSHS